MLRRFCFSICVSLVILPATLAGDWMQFRGPGGQGVSEDQGLPVTWSETENIVWKTRLPGLGTSSPITVGDAIFLTCYSGYAESPQAPGDQKNLMRHLVCLDRKSGAIRWSKDVKPELPESVYRAGNDGQHGYASSTPASDGESLFVFFGKSGVFRFDLAGNQLWSLSVGKGTTGWGSATSPLLYHNLVIVNASVESGALVALHKADGAVAWRLPGTASAWSSPMLVEVPGGKAELVLNLAGKPGKIIGIDPDTGQQLWSCAGNNDGYVVASVVSHDGVVYAIAGRTNRSVAVKAGGTGEVPELWTSRNDSRVNSPVYHAGYLYWLNEQRGMAMCIDAATGKEVYAQRVRGVGRAYASGVYGDGKIYYVTDNATTFVLAAKPQYELLATNKLEDTARTNASPVIDHGRLLIRTDAYLYCVGNK
jgi:outer membrane protein assembly factor BamB